MDRVVISSEMLGRRTWSEGRAIDVTLRVYLRVNLADKEILAGSSRRNL